MHGTHRNVSPEHLPVYLNEFVFRHNRRATPMAGFQTLLGLGRTGLEFVRKPGVRRRRWRASLLLCMEGPQRTVARHTVGRVRPGTPASASCAPWRRGWSSAPVWCRPWTWRDVAEDPLESWQAGCTSTALITGPIKDVFVSSQHYVLSAFSLDDKRHAAAKLAELGGTTIDELDVRWDRDAIDRAPTKPTVVASQVPGKRGGRSFRGV
jgi:hypothetical protein